MRNTVMRECLEEFAAAACTHPERTYRAEFRIVQSIPLPPKGAIGRFFITPHAVHRYRERFARRLSYAEALRELMLITNAGKRVGASHRGGGAEIWRGPRIGTKLKQDARSRLRFIVDKKVEGHLPQVVTVLEPQR